MRWGWVVWSCCRQYRLTADTSRRPREGGGRRRFTRVPPSKAASGRVQRHVTLKRPSRGRRVRNPPRNRHEKGRSEEHTSELQSLMRISYAVFCLKKKKKTHTNHNHKRHNTSKKQSSETPD